ncbi:hypothetical protein [Joostella sp. CR20]|uniref:hypothetical protein n=1 Tax=Joostella sp. CR20 TaxID=2804312 RepID=UPI00313CFB1C
MTTTTNKTPFFTLKLIFYFFLAGQIIFLGVAFYLMQSLEFNFENPDMMSYLVPCFAIAAVFIGNYIYQQTINTIKREDTFFQKMAKFQTANIIKFAMIESASLFAIVKYLISSNAIYAVIAILLILYFTSLIPNKEKIISLLNLTSEERKLL